MEITPTPTTEEAAAIAAAVSVVHQEQLAAAAASAPVQAQTPAATGPSASRIAWISPERIYNESKLAKLAGEKLAEEFKSREKAVQEMAARLKLSSEKLEKDLPSLSEADRSKRQRDYFELDKEFHAGIIRVGGGRRVSALHRSVRPQVERYWRLYASSIVSDLQESVSEHNDIVRAIRKGDGPAVQAAIERLEENRTVVCVAHRLSTLANMDRIIVLSQGRIVEEGTFNELLQRGGTFATMARKQGIFAGHAAAAAR